MRKRLTCINFIDNVLLEKEKILQVLFEIDFARMFLRRAREAPMRNETKFSEYFKEYMKCFILFFFQILGKSHILKKLLYGANQNSAFNGQCILKMEHMKPLMTIHAKRAS